MAQRCRVCSHKKTKEIEQLIVQGKANTQIAEQFGLDHQSVRYHRINHLPEKLVKSVKKKKEKHAENMLDGINDLLERTKNILDEAEGKGQKSLALKAIKEARSTYELLSKIAVKLEEYRRQDEEKKEGMQRLQVQEGLKALSDQELKAYIQLQAKIHSNDSDYDLDPNVRTFVDGVRQIWPETKTSDEANGVGTSFHDDSSHSDSVGSGGRQDKNNQNKRSDDEEIELDDLDDLDLSLDDDENTIPSDEDDPDWLQKKRRRRNRRL